MPQVPAATLSAIKAARPLAAVLTARGVDLQREGRDLVCCCPLPGHDDKTPSFHITEDDAESVAHCFGCDWAGNVFQLLQALDGCSFVEAVDTAARAVGIPFDPSRYLPPKRRAAPADACPLDPDADDPSLAAQIMAFYQQRLMRSESAGWAYLRMRGLDDLELVRRYSLGYCERGRLGRLLPNKQVAVGRELRSRLESLGWFKAGTGHEYFAGRIVVPVFDESGVVAGAYGRSMRSLKAEPPHKYMKGQHRAVWNTATFAPDGAAAKEKTLILTEALIDGLTYAKHGYHNVTASYGTNGFTNMHLDLMTRAGIETVIIAYDHDSAGENAAAKLAPELTRAGMQVLRAALPPGADVNSYAVGSMEEAPEAIHNTILRATWLGGGRSVSVPELPTTPEPAETVSSPAAAAPAANEPTPCDQAEAGGPAPGLVAGVDGVSETGDAVEVKIGNRVWRLIGLENVQTLQAIKTTLRVTVGTDFHHDQCDLANARQRKAFAADAAQEIPVQPALLQADVKKLLLFAESWIEKREAAKRAEAEETPDPLAAMDDGDKEAALAMLRDPQLIDRICGDLDACGLVGERTNKLVAYLAATSRKMAQPLAVLVQSSSAAGKTTLMDAIVSMMPEEDARRYSAISPKALYYLGQDRLRHQILAIAEEEGAEEASYSLKLLQSDGSLVFACPMKQGDGSIRTEEVRIDGPIMLFLTTTKNAIDGELENRCVKLTVDEDAGQTAAIHSRQRGRDTWTGVEGGETNDGIKRLHQNAQRLLRPIRVVNQYAPQLTFATDRPRLRRDHQKYLDLIKAITFLHQYQREHETRIINGTPIEAVLTTPEDIKLANDLAHVVLGRSLDDLPPQPRRLLGLLYEIIQPLAEKSGCPISRYDITLRQLLPHLPFGMSQLRAHLTVLAEHEYVVAYRTHAAEPMKYRLLSDEAPGERSHICLGLVDPATICNYDASLPGFEAPLPDRCRPVTGSLPARYRMGENVENTDKSREICVEGENRTEENKTPPKGGDVVPNTDVVSDDDEDEQESA